MSIFDLHTQVLADYRDFVRSFFTIADERARQFIEHALVEEAKLWPDFLLQVSPAYVRPATVDDLAAQRVLALTIAELMKKEKLTKDALAKCMRTSRAALDRLLDPTKPSVTLVTLGKAACALGRTLRVELS